MKTFSTYRTAELKAVYRVLHGQLRAHLELLDSDLLSDLQTYLQELARTEGVDVSDHAAWEDWLAGGGASAPKPLALAGGALN
ncbi:MAG: hypothetical protein D6731_09295 [Planctomycetota bacterium]|nr:MAG: hypothetical protein D6731_09295 [Planctomycetota bacterium]